MYETYEQCHSTASFDTASGDAILLPIGHTTQEAQIEITIDHNGDFSRAAVLPKTDSQTIIPCTEESGGRSGKKPKPHPLSDKLQYVAKDFSEFGGTVTSGYAENPMEPYEEYEKLLSAWCESGNSDPKAVRVLDYIRKGTVIKDLVNYGVLVAGPDGELIEQWEKKPIPEIFKVSPNKRQAEAFVRWSVEIPGDPQTKLHTDRKLFESWAKYYESTKTHKTLCYVTGDLSFAAEQHPKKLRHDADQAKIISSNDTSGFTFRGRFQTSDQACGVSYEVTQKAHNALRWLIRKQGYMHNDQAIVAWSTAGIKVPDPLMDSFDFLDNDSLVPATTSEEFAHKLNQKLRGYHTNLGDSADIVVMGIDSATPGRISITFYRELTGSDFLNRIKNWYETCSWWISRDKQKIAIKYIGTPALSDIAESAYGKNISDKLQKSTLERLLPCIIDGEKLPADIVESCVRRASNRIGIEKRMWEKTLSIACAIYRKYYWSKGFNMSLEENRKSRDYLYGRLLALADNIESWALNESDENRQTTAARLMNRFAEHPFTTWRTIYLALAPYKARLGKKVSSREKLITEVGSKFLAEDFKSDKKLSGEFLLGYYCQREALWISQKTNSQGQILDVDEKNEVNGNVGTQD
ncbi:MAG: type I-C CRISPR-associated protein Cas8c/Csd1 [Candidatus Thermoplasmatota archaeon]|nr:type I-C CRISPR-associated protein Cas8c/Csd1 [Candidatus Thermoplasmatota archaeon]